MLTLVPSSVPVGMLALLVAACFPVANLLAVRAVWWGAPLAMLGAVRAGASVSVCLVALAATAPSEGGLLPRAFDVWPWVGLGILGWASYRGFLALLAQSTVGDTSLNVTESHSALPAVWAASAMGYSPWMFVAAGAELVGLVLHLRRSSIRGLALGVWAGWGAYATVLVSLPPLSIGELLVAESVVFLLLVAEAVISRGPRLAPAQVVYMLLGGALVGAGLAASTMVGVYPDLDQLGPTLVVNCLVPALMVASAARRGKVAWAAAWVGVGSAAQAVLWHYG